MTTIIPGLYGLDSATAWRALQKDPQKYITAFTKSNKQVQSDTDYFNKKLATFKTSADLFKDPRALKYVLESYGLGTETDSAGLIKKVLTEDPTATGALSSKLADTRYATMAKALRLDKGLDSLKTAASSGKLNTSFVQNEFEEALGEQDSALRQTAYFARNENTISNVYSVLGDKVLRDVVTNTLGLPAQLAIQPIETQAATIAKRVDFTKFATSAGAASATQLSRAKSDHDLIGTNLAISDAALKQIKALQTQLTQLATDYSNVDTITDPNGPNANLITIQTDAVPELARYEELLRKGDSTMTSVDASIKSLKDIFTAAQNPNSNLANLKAQFNDLVTSITSKIDNSTVTTFDGSENILLNGSADTLTTVIDENNTSVSMSRYDATSLKTLITDAQTAFNAVTGSGDSANLLTTQSKLLLGQDHADAIHGQIKTDLANLNTKVTGSAFFAAPLNSSDLTKGKQSVDDGLSRNAQVAGLLKKITALATQSKNLSSTADRTALETQFEGYRTQIRSLIENTGSTGLDNFLNNAPDKNYEIDNGKNIQVKGNFNLDSTISDALDNMNLNDSTAAGNLETQSILMTTQTDTVAASLNNSKPILDRVVSTYDPHARLDIQVTALKTQLDGIIAGAAKNGVNLLSATQKDIKLSSLSSGNNLTFRAQTSLSSDLLTGINAAIGQLGNGSTAMVNAIDDLSDIVTAAQRSLQSDNRVATMEYGKLGATIDILDPKNTSATSTLYQTNSFTQKFLSRYLTLNGSSGTTSSSSSYLANLFSTDSSTATASLTSLAISLKA